MRDSPSSSKRRNHLRYHLICVIVALSVVRAGISLFDFDRDSNQFDLKSQHGSIRKTNKPSLETNNNDDNDKTAAKSTTWAVATTINGWVNEAVSNLVTRNKDNLSLVMVGDKKTDDSVWRKFASQHDNVVYLSEEDQNKLPFKLIQKLPWNVFGRKNVGFLYAVAQGAKMIYDFDDDNHLMESFQFDKTLASMKIHTVETSHHLWNPYPYYEPTLDGTDAKDTCFVWPRGIPLQFINDKSTHDVPVTLDEALSIDNIAIVQSLANHDPDVDAIYRMTRQLPMTFNKQDSLTVVPRGTFVPWNAQAVFAWEAGFFGLYLPVTVTWRVADIWRSYITTRLLWETEMNLAFSPAMVTQYRNPHSYQKDFDEEDDLYHKADAFLNTLAKWTSDGFESLDGAYIDLMTVLVKEGFFEEADLELVKAFVDDLNTLGYSWPKIVKRMETFVPRSRPIVEGVHRLPDEKSSKTEDGADASKEAAVPNAFPKKRDENGTKHLDEKYKVWAVATTINGWINEAVANLITQNKDVALVMVGDKKTDDKVWQDFELLHRNVLYLSEEDQNKLPFKLIQKLPWNVFGRKNVGFLYAVAQGAKMIYDFDDDNHLMESFQFNKTLASMKIHTVETSHHLWNPYPYYEPTLDGTDAKDTCFVWPRGIPLQFINDKSIHDVPVTLDEALSIDNIAIVQSLANHDPDVDAIYRMTRQLPMTFNKQDSLTVVPRGTFVPWNAQAVFAWEAGFFGLYLPVTVTWRVADIWRSYITTRLLWETEMNLAFSPAMVTQYRNPHSYQKDFDEEDDLYHKADAFLNTLAKWTSDGFESLDGAYIHLMTVLVKEGFFEEADLELVKDFVDDLNALGYSWPKIVKRMETFVPRSRPVVDEKKVALGPGENES